MLMLVTILTASAQDLSLAPPFGTVLSPLSGCSLTANENMTIRLFNFGSNVVAGTSFNLSYSINGGPAITEMVTLGPTLLSKSTLTYTFVTQANLSAEGVYSVDFTVSMPGDINASNNTYQGFIINNYAPSAGGTISGSTTACAASNSGTLTLSGYTGSVVRWEYSTDNGNTWYYVSNTTTSQSYSNLKQTTWYRAVVQNGSCAPAFSATAIVTINC